MSVRDYNATAASNTAISGTDISEGCSPAGINNAIRQQMADIKDVSTGAVALESPAVDQLNFADNAKAIWGSGGDLSVYHDGSNSYITEGGDQTGDLFVRASNLKLTNASGDFFLWGRNADSVRLYHNNAQKLETKATGADITGVLTADGVTVTGTNADLVLGTSGSNVTFNRNGDNYISASGGASSNIILDPQNRLAVNTGGSERLRVDSSGDLLVGCTSLPSSSVAGLGIDVSNDSELKCSVSSTGNSTQIRFLNPNGEVGAIRTNGSATSYITSSDYRIKENVVADWDATTRLKQLNPVRFNFIADANTTVDGFLAHEVQAVVPECVTGTHNEVEVWKDSEELPDGVSVGDNKLDENGNTIPVMQGIDQSKLTPLLTKALIEAVEKIEQLETRIAALEA